MTSIVVHSGIVYFQESHKNNQFDGENVRTPERSSSHTKHTALIFSDKRMVCMYMHEYECLMT